MKKIFSIVFIFMFFFISYADAATWHWIYSDDEVSVWVDNDSVSKGNYHDEYDFRAFIKITYSYAGKKAEIEKYRRDDGTVPEGMYKLSHTIDFYHFKKIGGVKYMAIPFSTVYTDDLKVIDEISYRTDRLDWYEIIPDSLGDGIYENVYARVRGK